VTSLLVAKVIPLGVALVVGAAALALSFTRWRHIGEVLLGFALVTLWIAATPALANWLNWQLESQFPPLSADRLPQSEAVIVLGGVLGQPTPPRVAADLSDSTDRIMHALRVYRVGKAPLIVISAGNQPWQTATASEAQLIADLFMELGVPRSALVLETKSRNTHENAANTAAIFKEHGWRNGILVTSGFHMPRALAAFRHEGLVVTPAATDVHSVPARSAHLFDILPDAKALARTTSAIQEMIGLCYYRLRGWA
jgi:uncharacterized SAM-binding protein YcdF (DUF218 family)